jgi:hypothetical protein
LAYIEVFKIGYDYNEVYGHLLRNNMLDDFLVDEEGDPVDIIEDFLCEHFPYDHNYPYYFSNSYVYHVESPVYLNQINLK